MIHAPPKTLLLIPVYNERANIAPLLAEIRQELPDLPVCLIDDCSRDDTQRVLREMDCDYLTLPCNLGVGGAMQTGFRYAFERGYQYVIRLDGDGQHPPAECARLIERMANNDVDMVVGSRFLGETDYTGTWYRHTGIRVLAAALSVACQRRITDPTSGFQMVNRAVMYYFAHQYPTDYPEPESLALLSRQGYRCCEIPTAFRSRTHGTSSIQAWGTFYYLFKVGIALSRYHGKLSQIAREQALTENRLRELEKQCHGKTRRRDDGDDSNDEGVPSRAPRGIS